VPKDAVNYDSCTSTAVNNGTVPQPEAPASATYTVTYWATIESGDKSIHVPIDSSNICGSEKAIIEESAGMKKVWKWVQEKGLGDKVSLQDAFDFTKDMLIEDEDEDGKTMIEEMEPARPTSRTPSRCSTRFPSAWDV
jgi:hypothetical protein